MKPGLQRHTPCRQVACAGQTVPQAPQLVLVFRRVHVPLQQPCPLGHVPQVRVPPQPSGMEPQFFPCATQLVGVQPHTFGVPPPPQVCGGVHVPQLSVPPQPLDAVPQVWPAGQLLAGIHGEVGMQAHPPMSRVAQRPKPLVPRGGVGKDAESPGVRAVKPVWTRRAVP
jgi:hypothetical protein